MKYVSIILLVILTASCVGGGDLYYQALKKNQEIPSKKGQLDHSKWNSLLKKYVNETGFVDYDSFKKEHDELKEYLSYLNVNSPQETWSINEQFAYYINLYNAATVDLILMNDMPESIKDIDGPLGQVWLKKFILVNDKEYSLAAIEKNVLQKMGDARIHFAINCASYSCPKLQNKAFTAANVDALMDQSARDFINSDKNDFSNPGNPKLSSIFSFYPKDFTKNGMTLTEYINQYADTKIAEKNKYDYIEYDWSLNKQK
ncbi:DUF547 domain-containing protein [Nonlabens sp.]|uniref:DUF547 domain-containing protein n=1 Tax=Nonlabens sp. TaxID=1888209 RepID=UPI003F6A52A7